MVATPEALATRLHLQQMYQLLFQLRRYIPRLPTLRVALFRAQVERQQLLLGIVRRVRIQALVVIVQDTQQSLRVELFACTQSIEYF